MTDSRLDKVFTIDKDYVSDERYDIAKFIEFKGDVHDVLCCPFLMGLKKLPLWRYYRVDDGEKDIDNISFDAYGTLFYSFLIQYYNDRYEEEFPEGTVLKLFNVEDLENLYTALSNKDFDKIS